MCLGMTGSVARIATNGALSRVVTGLPSIGSESDATGPADITFTGNHKFALAIGLGGTPAFREGFGPQGEWLAHVVTGDLRTGKLTAGTDLAAYEESANPDGTDVDSNPVSVARWGNTEVVADAGGNSVVRTPGTTLGVLPPVPAFGPDATGLTNVTSIAFSDSGRLYAVEIAENGFLSGPIGRLARVTPGASSHTTVAGGLFAPYGMAIRGSHAWVTTGSVLPAGGQVVRIGLR